MDPGVLKFVFDKMSIYFSFVIGLSSFTLSNGYNNLESQNWEKLDSWSTNMPLFVSSNSTNFIKLGANGPSH